MSPTVSAFACVCLLLIIVASVTAEMLPLPWPG
jgi:hypothetical protein